MEYSKENTMSRKDYIKSKQSHKSALLKRIKYLLLVCVIVLLGIYVFKQLNVYNNVTKIANKVVEEAALAKTMKMYYVAEGYVKEPSCSVMLYKTSDESRTKIANSENLTSIKIDSEVLYGIDNNKLYKIDMATGIREQVTEQSVLMYFVAKNKIYMYVYDDASKDNTGIYVLDILTNESKKIIDGNIYQLDYDDKYIYVVAEGKTSKSIIRYLFDGTDKTQLTTKEIVSHMSVTNDGYIYYTNSSEEDSLYRITKDGKEVSKVTENKIQVADTVMNKQSIKASVAATGEDIYYINASDNNILYHIDKEKKESKLIEKSIESIQLIDNILYYKINETIGIFKYNIETGKTEQVTSARTNEYICVN